MSLTDYLNEYDMTDGGLKELQRRLDAEWTNGYPQAHQMAMISFLDRLEKKTSMVLNGASCMVWNH